MIECLQLGKSYGKSCELFRGATLRVGKGEMVVVSGGAGSGKSTLMRLLLAREIPDCGQVLLLGLNVHESPPRQLSALRRKLGLVSPDGPVAPAWTVFENVALPLVVAGKESGFVRKKVMQTLEHLDLQRKAPVRCEALNASERRRVQIARALVHNPLIVLADEPFEGLEPGEKARSAELIAALNVAGSTVMILSRFTPRVLGMERARWVRIAHGRFVEGFSTSIVSPGAAASL